jgi:regulator of protease activity HflC (stomatin/prohibitin superfamily)
MFLFVVAIILVLVGAGLAIKGYVGDAYLRGWATLAVILGLIVFFLSMIAIVPTKNIGVTVAFGKPTGTLSNGWHIVAPWESVATYDATIQTPDLDKLPVFDVRIANNMTAKMRLSVDWQLADEADITKIHSDWRGFDKIEPRVVNPRLFDALNKVFENYDPLAAITPSKEGVVVETVSFADLTAKVKTELEKTLPTGVAVRRLQIPFAEWPKVIQEGLDNFRKELAATQTALQQKVTAQAQKDAIDILAGAKLTPEAFAQQCLIVTERLAQQGKLISPAWTCVAGSAQSVVPVR